MNSYIRLGMISAVMLAFAWAAFADPAEGEWKKSERFGFPAFQDEGGQPANGATVWIENPADQTIVGYVDYWNSGAKVKIVGKVVGSVAANVGRSFGQTGIKEVTWRWVPHQTSPNQPPHGATFILFYSANSQTGYAKASTDTLADLATSDEDATSFGSCGGVAWSGIGTQRWGLRSFHGATLTPTTNPSESNARTTGGSIGGGLGVPFTVTGTINWGATNAASNQDRSVNGAQASTTASANASANLNLASVPPTSRPSVISERAQQDVTVSVYGCSANGDVAGGDDSADKSDFLAEASGTADTTSFTITK